MQCEMQRCGCQRYTKRFRFLLKRTYFIQNILGRRTIIIRRAFDWTSRKYAGIENSTQNQVSAKVAHIKNVDFCCSESLAALFERGLDTVTGIIIFYIIGQRINKPVCRILFRGGTQQAADFG